MGSGKRFYLRTLSLLGRFPGRGHSFKSSLSKIVRKDRADRRPDDKSSFSFVYLNLMQQQGVGPLQVHGIPGTPVGDLFPPGNAVFGDGNRSSIRPIRAGELRSHSAVLNNVLVKHQDGFKRNSANFSRVFCPRDGFSKAPSRAEWPAISSPS